MGIECKYIPQMGTVKKTDRDQPEKIIDAAMELIMEIGYTAATTKDIARRAGVNECTIFRKFGEKKEIVLRP